MGEERKDLVAEMGRGEGAQLQRGRRGVTRSSAGAPPPTRAAASRPWPLTPRLCKYEREASRYWDLFYKRNGERVSACHVVHSAYHCHSPLALLCVAHSVSTPPPHSLFPFPPSPPRLAVAPCLCAQFFKDRHYLHHEWALFLRGDAGTGRAAEAGTEGGKEGGAEGGGGEARAGDAGAGAGSAGGGGGCGGGREGCVCERCVAIRRVVLEVRRVVLSGRWEVEWGVGRGPCRVGCGAGNTVFPLLADDPHLFALACDFSPRAVALVTVRSGVEMGVHGGGRGAADGGKGEGSEHYDAHRLRAFVADITADPLATAIATATATTSSSSSSSSGGGGGGACTSCVPQCPAVSPPSQVDVVTMVGAMWLPWWVPCGYHGGCHVVTMVGAMWLPWWVPCGYHGGCHVVTMVVPCGYHGGCHVVTMVGAMWLPWWVPCGYHGGCHVVTMVGAMWLPWWVPCGYHGGCHVVTMVGAMWLPWWVPCGYHGGCHVVTMVGAMWLPWWVPCGYHGGCHVVTMVGAMWLPWWVPCGYHGGCHVVTMVGAMWLPWWVPCGYHGGCHVVTMVGAMWLPWWVPCGYHGGCHVVTMVGAMWLPWWVPCGYHGGCHVVTMVGAMWLPWWVPCGYHGGCHVNVVQGSSHHAMAWHHPTFHHPTFHHPTFHHPTFHHPTFHHPTFHHPTFHHPTFHHPTFHHPTFHHPTFHHPTFHHPTFHHPTFHHPTFHHPTFHHPTFHHPTFHHPTFHHPTFHHPTFHHPTFHHPTFHHPTFHHPTFHHPTFHHPTFHHPTFHHPTFHHPTFHHLTLTSLLPTATPRSEPHAQVFVLSAISPEKMPLAVANCVLSLGPHVVRPSAASLYPPASILPATPPCRALQERLRRKEQRIADNFYVRGDGTRAYYFTEAALGELFAGAGMQCVHMGVCERTVTNRARQIDMHRRWIQAVFRLPPAATAAPSAPSAPSAASATAAEDVGAGGMSDREGGEEERSGSGSSVVQGEGRGREGAGATEKSGREEGCREEGGTGGSDITCEVDCSGLFLSDPPLEVLLSPSAPLSHPLPPSPLSSPLSFPSLLRPFRSCPFPFPPLRLSNPTKTSPNPPPIAPQDHALSLAHLPLRVRLLSREHQHTHGSTGRLLWESSQVLAALLLAHPALTHHASVLELGAGGAALCSLAATHSTPRVIVATDGDENALSLLSGNLELNAGSFETGRIKVCRLRWGDEGDEAAVRQLLPCHDVIGADEGHVQEEGGATTASTQGSHARTAPVGGSSMKGDDTEAAYTAAQQGRGFDVILGADVVYVRAAVPLLFQSAARLLARWDGSGRVPVLLLCHITRQVLEPDVLAAAAAAGLEVAEGEVAERIGGSVERAMQAAVGTAFPGESRDASLFRLLCFRASRLS
ncbi:unnamed protein product [Closterium sp. NIES-65]|nr:unnamed protein product [Closterium sp. NIES-65]